MIEVKYLGHAAFYIKTGRVKIITDPFPPEVGFKMKRLEADVVTVSHNHYDHAYIKGVNGRFVVISGPGEYEVKGVHIRGFRSYHDDKQGQLRGVNTIYRFQVDDTTLVHLGDLGHALDDDLLELMGEVDVVFVPVGGYYTLEMDEVIKVIEQLEPKYIVPMHYRTSQHETKTFAPIAPLETFLQAMGVKAAEVTQDRLVVKKDTDTSQVVVLNRWE